MLSTESLEKIIEMYPESKTVLDVGGGILQEHSLRFSKEGKEVTLVDYDTGPESERLKCVQGDFMSITNLGLYDIVWSSHNLEHQLNINLYIQHLFSHLKNDGLMMITVPPKKDTIDEAMERKKAEMAVPEFTDTEARKFVKEFNESKKLAN